MSGSVMSQIFVERLMATVVQTTGLWCIACLTACLEHAAHTHDYLLGACNLQTCNIWSLPRLSRGHCSRLRSLCYSYSLFEQRGFVCTARPVLALSGLTAHWRVYLPSCLHDRGCNPQAVNLQGSRVIYSRIASNPLNQNKMLHYCIGMLKPTYVLQLSTVSRVHPSKGHPLGVVIPPACRSDFFHMCPAQGHPR